MDYGICSVQTIAPREIPLRNLGNPELLELPNRQGNGHNRVCIWHASLSNGFHVDLQNDFVDFAE
jgi:hypothetical protein